MSKQTIDGVPGLRSLIERVTSQDLGMSAKKDRAEAAHELRALLDAEQPAPVSVATPERKTVLVGVLSESNTHNQGWNACLDELKRLNPSL